jgi:dihydrolipoamide dehydrogenase
VLGGGVIGVEFASVWKSFGADVTIVEALPHGSSPPRTRPARRPSSAPSASARSPSAPACASRPPRRTRRRHVTPRGRPSSSADVLLVAVGRGPNDRRVGLRGAGHRVERGFVPVDERCAPTSGVYAVGDIVPGLQLAHRGFAQGIFVAEDIAGLNPAPVADEPSRGSPTASPRSPGGLTEAQAASSTATASSPMSTTSAATARARSCDPAGSSSSCGSRTARSSGSTWSARIGEQVGEAQLIVSWEALPEDVAA